MGPMGKENIHKLWNELTILLNSMGHGEKTCEEWKKTLADFKCKAKAKAAKIQQHLNKTGGGGSTTLSLSNNENKLLSLMGRTAIEGDSVHEYGLKRKAVDTVDNRTKKIVTIPTLETSDQEIDINNTEILFINETNDNQEELMQPTEIIIEDKRDEPCKKTTNTNSKRNTHEILSNNVKTINKETLNVLKKIENHMENINNNLARLTNAIEKIVKNLEK